MNVVSIMAHQDDEMGCLGTMLKCRDRGDELSFITATDGSKGFVQSPGISREEAAGIRHAEMTALADEIGAKYINLRELDEFLYDTPDVRMKLIEAIRSTRAELVFTHYAEDYNLDHTTVHSLVRHCAMHSSLPVLPTESPSLEVHPAIFLTVPSGPIHFPASHYVDITDYHQRKVALMRKHASQEEAMKQALGTGLGELVERLDAFRGEQVGCRYAECFIPMQARGALKPFRVLP